MRRYFPDMLSVHSNLYTDFFTMKTKFSFLEDNTSFQKCNRDFCIRGFSISPPPSQYAIQKLINLIIFCHRWPYNVIPIISQDFQTRHDPIPTTKLFIARRHRKNRKNFSKKKLKIKKSWVIHIWIDIHFVPTK